MDQNSAPMTKQDMQTILQAIQESESRVREHVDNRLAELRIELKAEIAELRIELKGELADLETRLREEITVRLEALETKLLGAFFNYQEYDRIENRKFRADLSNVSAASELRFDNFESRISALEKVILSARPPAS